MKKALLTLLFLVYASTVNAASAPTNFSATVSGSSVSISWTAATGASGYKVYYGTTSGTYLNASTGANLGNTTSYTFTNIPAGTYYLALKSYDSSATLSDYSTEISVTVSGTTLSAPTNLSVTTSGSTINVSWTAATGASGYKLYYGTTSGTYLNASTGLDVGNVTSQTFNSIPDGTYYLALKSYNSSGTLSSYSNETSGTVALPDANITVDGNLSDWSGVRTMILSDTSGDSTSTFSASSFDIIEAGATQSGTKIALYIKTSGSILSGTSATYLHYEAGIHLYSDQSCTTSINDQTGTINYAIAHRFSNNSGTYDELHNYIDGVKYSLTVVVVSNVMEMSFDLTSLPSNVSSISMNPYTMSSVSYTDHYDSISNWSDSCFTLK
ncbi:MAG: hypothetical protein HQK84_10730 [Nitrospinae bacterium]|nr:hypothetical protein [Nitrospinota bacterium]